MKAARSLVVILVLLSSISTLSRAEAGGLTVSLRGGMASAIDSRYSSRFPAGAFPMLSLGLPVSDRWSVVASAAYRQNSTFANSRFVSIPEIHVIRNDQDESLIPASLGLRFEPLGRARSQPGFFFEAAPALYVYQWDRHLESEYEGTRSATHDSVHRLQPGLQVGLVGPGRFTSRLGWELGLFYFYTPSIVRDGRTFFRGMNHISLAGGLSVRL